MQVILKNNKEILKDIEMFDNTFGMSPIKKNETLMGPVLSDGSVTQVPSTSQFPRRQSTLTFIIGLGDINPILVNTWNTMQGLIDVTTITGAFGQVSSRRTGRFIFWKCDELITQSIS